MADLIAFVLLLAITAYSTAGGVDFGAGIWDLLAGTSSRGRQARALIDHAMAPVWEVNNVWLVLSVVLCWTAFPALFQVTFSSLYPLFTVALPGVVQGSTPREVRPLAPRASHGRVLVVDDNVDAAMTLAEAVRLDGHDVRVSHDGDAALRDAASFVPEVVLLDIGLPGMDGYEVVGRLRRLPQLARTLMVALTGFGQESDRVRALAAGFDEHLVKPVDLDTVHGVLRRRLGTA